MVAGSDGRNQDQAQEGEEISILSPELLGLDIQCPPLEVRYNQMMRQRNIVDDTDPNKCCTVRCPTDLPDWIMGERGGK